MPVRSLNSSVLKWPDAGQVQNALRDWALRQAARCPGLRAVGLIGSYARGDWGVGSDADVIVLVEECADPFERRSRGWDCRSLPVAADVLVYTVDEFAALDRRSGFGCAVERDVVWVYGRGLRDEREG